MVILTISWKQRKVEMESEQHKQFDSADDGETGRTPNNGCNAIILPGGQGFGCLFSFSFFFCRFRFPAISDTEKANETKMVMMTRECDGQA